MSLRWSGVFCNKSINAMRLLGYTTVRVFFATKTSNVRVSKCVVRVLELNCVENTNDAYQHNIRRMNINKC